MVQLSTAIVLVSIVVLLCAPNSTSPSLPSCSFRYWWYKRITSGPETAELPSVAGAVHGKPTTSSKTVPTGPKVAVLYGSQTGTAESYAKVFAKEAVSRNLDAKAVDMDDFDECAVRKSCDVL